MVLLALEPHKLHFILFNKHAYCLIGDNGRLQYLRLFVEMYVNVVFVIRLLYSAVSLTLVREQRFIKIKNKFIIIIINNNNLLKK